MNAATHPILSLRDTAKAAERQMLLDAAARLLIRHGLAGLSLRKLATEVGASTTAVYTHFGSKEALLRALYDEGWLRLDAHQSAVPDPHPLTHLTGLAYGYRAWAKANPIFFALMSGHLLSEFAPPKAEGIREHPAFQHLRRAVAGCLEERILKDMDPMQATDLLWAGVHGMVALEVAGLFASEEVADQRFEACLTAMSEGLMCPPTDWRSFPPDYAICTPSTDGLLQGESHD